jgi:hypothetical protein
VSIGEADRTEVVRHPFRLGMAYWAADMQLLMPGAAGRRTGAAT